jgi:hypothetical protein
MLSGSHQGHFLENMKFVLITKDPDIEAAAREGFHPADTCIAIADWQAALDQAGDADLMFVDLIATLDEPGKIAGYERFAEAKMTHEVACGIPLILISPPPDYDLDFMAGWPNFVLGHVQRPVSSKIFRRASTWV